MKGVSRTFRNDVHQGARRPEAVQRVGILHRMHDVSLRAETDPIAVFTDYIDRAAGARSRGKHGEAEVELAGARAGRFQ